jgi:hypothetical protein
MVMVDAERMWMDWISGYLEGCLGKNHPAVGTLDSLRRRGEKISYEK